MEDALSEHQRPKLDRYATHSFVTCHAIRCEGPQEPRRDRDRLLRREAVADHRPQGRGLPDPGAARPVGAVERPDRPGRGVTCSTPCSTSSSTATSRPSTGSTTTTTRSARACSPTSRSNPNEQRDWFEARRSLVHFHRLVAPMREVVSGLMRREQGSVAGAAVPLLPGPLRPRAARGRVDRRAA